MVGGYPGKRIVIRNWDDPPCPEGGSAPDGYVRIWENRDGTEVGMLDAGFAIVLIADVDGERLVFTAWTPGHEFYGVYPGQGRFSERDLAQLEADADALAASIEIVSRPVTGEIAYAHAVYDPTGTESPRDLALFTVSTEDPSPRRPTRLADVPEAIPWPVSGLVGPVVRWSPDGSRIAFRLFNDEAGIWLMDRDGSDLHRLVDLPLDQGPRTPFLEAIDWSPDGTRIAYTYPYDGPRSPLYVVDVEDGAVTNLTGDDPSRGATRALAWSPDGSRIAFARTESDRRDGLFVMDADGTGEIHLTDPQLLGHIRGLAWSPDGSRIAFIWQSLDEPSTTLKVVDDDGSEVRDISSWSAGGCCFPEATDLRPLAWSPDGARIVTVEEPGPDQPEGQAETIVLVHPDGSGESVLTEGSFFDLSPDGSRIVVAEARLDTDPGPYSIRVMNLDGTGVEWLADGEFPVWSPARG
jgi:dipeptidyl aminopeptidase/acylaminoacyl peptidase